MAIKLSPNGKEETDQSQEKAQARAQGGPGKSSEDRHGTVSKPSVSGSNCG